MEEGEEGTEGKEGKESDEEERKVEEEREKEVREIVETERNKEGVKECGWSRPSCSKSGCLLQVHGYCTASASSIFPKCTIASALPLPRRRATLLRRPFSREASISPAERERERERESLFIEEVAVCKHNYGEVTGSHFAYLLLARCVRAVSSLG